MSKRPSYPSGWCQPGLPSHLCPAPSKRAPDGVTLTILGKPPAEPVLQLSHQGGGVVRTVLRAAERAWLLEHLARWNDPPKT
jgi:hypothetical protein